jgi:hypothetical protein
MWWRPQSLTLLEKFYILHHSIRIKDLMKHSLRNRTDDPMNVEAEYQFVTFWKQKPWWSVCEPWFTMGLTTMLKSNFCPQTVCIHRNIDADLLVLDN